MATHHQVGEKQTQPAVESAWRPLPAGTPQSVNKADRVVVEKARRQLCLYQGADLLKTYPVALGQRPCGPKRCAGDMRTPEGCYVLDWRNPDSRFFRSIHVSYPNANDQRNARLREEDPGGDIMIHGAPASPGDRARMLGGEPDWTAGCIAVCDADMLEIWEAVDDGTPIEILP